MGKLTISMAIFNSYVSHYQRVPNLVLYPTIKLSIFSVFQGPTKDSEAASAGAESQQRGRRQVFR